jgi:hypothetical protein
MKTLAATLALALGCAPLAAQAPLQLLSLALPEHPGKLSLDLSKDAGHWQVGEFTARPNGAEFGMSAADGGLTLQARLFLSTLQTHMTASSCRDQVLVMEDAKPNTVHKDTAVTKSAAGAEIATVMPSAKTFRAFVASGDVCGDMLFTEDGAQPLPLDRIKALLQTVRFDPLAKPSFHDAFAYATTEFDHQEMDGAARGYRAALALASTTEDPLKWQRVSTDQLAMALGMAGDITGSRAVNIAAIKRDPNYPMYYYNLACADGVENNAADAQRHLKQAFDRRANVLPGETMPDPATDDSFQVLMQDPSFQAFVKTLNAAPPSQ